MAAPEGLREPTAGTTPSAWERVAAECLRAGLAKPGARVTEVARLESGWETEVSLFSLAPPGEPSAARRLVLRVYPGNDAAEKSRREYQAMGSLRALGYPVPEVYLLRVEDSPLGKPFVVMERIEGQTLAAAARAAPEADRPRWRDLFCRLLADLHSLDWRPRFDDPFAGRWTPQAPLGRVLEQTREGAERLGVSSSPSLTAVLAWVESHLESAPCRRPSLVHGDFHPHNVLVDDAGRAAVIDWANVGITDSRLDLAQTLVLFASHDGQAARDEVLRGYEQVSGRAVEALEVFETLAATRRLYSMVLSVSKGAEHLGMRPGAEARMRDPRPLAALHEIIHSRSGVRIREAEDLLAALG